MTLLEDNIAKLNDVFIDSKEFDGFDGYTQQNLICEMRGAAFI